MISPLFSKYKYRRRLSQVIISLQPKALDEQKIINYIIGIFVAINKGSAIRPLLTAQRIKYFTNVNYF